MSETKTKKLLEEPAEPTTVKIQRPIKDLNGMVYAWEEIEVPLEKSQSTPIPGGLAGRPPF